MQRLSIQVQFPAIQIRTQPLKLDLERKDPQVQIELDMPRVHIDQQIPMEEIDAKGLYSFSRDRRNEAQLKMISAIGAVAREGDRMADIHHGVILSDLIVERTTPPSPEVTIAALPASRPQIGATGDIKVQFAEGSIVSRSELGSITIGLRPGSVEVSLDNEQIGQHIDRRI